MADTEQEIEEIIVEATRVSEGRNGGGGGGGGGGFLSGLGFGGHDWSGVLALGPGGISSDSTAFWLNWLTINILEQNGLPFPEPVLPQESPDPIIILPTPIVPTLPTPAPEWTVAQNDAFQFAVEQGWFDTSGWNYA